MIRSVIAIGLAITTYVLGGSALGQAAPPQPILCKLPSGTKSLPAGARHGLIQHMRQYPAIHLATPSQRARAALILEQLRATARTESWRDMAAVGRAGYKVRPQTRRRATGRFTTSTRSTRGREAGVSPSMPAGRRR